MCWSTPDTCRKKEKKEIDMSWNRGVVSDVQILLFDVTLFKIELLISSIILRFDVSLMRISMIVFFVWMLNRTSRISSPCDVNEFNLTRTVQNQNTNF